MLLPTSTLAKTFIQSLYTGGKLSGELPAICHSRPMQLF
jgi:hypothetical protein